MPALFADTSGWGNLVDSTQPYHSLAATIYRMARQQGRKVITTNYIIAELVMLLTSPLRIPRLMNRPGSYSEAIKIRSGALQIVQVLCS